VVCGPDSSRLPPASTALAGVGPTRWRCSTRSGVTCHPLHPMRSMALGFDPHPSGSMQQRHKRKEGEERTAEPHKQHYLRSSRWRY
jgi:hypothetical protein